MFDKRLEQRTMSSQNQIHFMDPLCLLLTLPQTPTPTFL